MWSVACGGTSAEPVPPVGDGGAAEGGASVSDGGTDAPRDAAPADLAMTVDLRHEAFPPLFPKLGYNSNWNTADLADTRAAQSAEALGMSLAAGLVETGEANEETGANATMELPPFVRDAQGNVTVRIDPDLRRLREGVRDRGLVSFLQWAGTPRPESGFSVDPSLTASTNGNHYPLPVPSETPALADAFAKLSLSLRQADGTPTMWAFWQEPDHTIGANLTRQRSLERFAPFFARAASGIVAGDRDAMVAGVQQNASAGISKGGVVDGADYATWVSVLLDYERTSGREVPLDVVSLQLYKAEAVTQILGNVRVAYASPRFSASPVLVNEWDFDKDIPFAEKYGTAAGLTRMLDAIVPLLTAPDVDSVLLTRNLLSAGPLAYGLVERLATMPILRRPTRVEGRDADAIAALASSDAASVSIVLSNRSDEARTIDVHLDGIAGLANLEQTTLAAPVAVGKKAIEPDGTVRGVVLPARTVVVLHGGERTAPPKLAGAVYARSIWSCPRRGGNVPPSGTGHFDPRSATLIAAAERGGNVGATGVVLRNVQATRFDLALDTNDPSATTSLRVDFLEGDAVTKSVRYGADSGKGAAMWGKVARFRAAGPTTEVNLPRAATTVSFVPGELAPVTWAAADGGARRLQISLAVESTGEDMHARVGIVGR